MTDLLYNCGDNSFRVNMPAHHKAHEWSNTVVGSDVINVHPRMFSLLRTTAVHNSILVKTSSFYYIKSGVIKLFPETITNLTAYIPTGTNNTRLVLIGLNTTTNTIYVAAGAQTFNSASTPPPFPVVPDGVIPSALVKMISGITVVAESAISDARVFLGGGTGVSISVASDVEVKAATDDTKAISPAKTKYISQLAGDIWLHRASGFRERFDSFSAAYTAAANGDSIVIHNTTVDFGGSAFTIAKQLVIEGTGFSTITGSQASAPTLTVTTSGVVFRNLTITHVSSGTASGAVAFAGGAISFYDCYITGTGSASVNYGVWTYGNSVVHLYHTTIAMNLPATRCLYENGGWAKFIMYHGELDCGETGYEFYGTNTSSTFTINGTRITNGVYSWSGSKSGHGIMSYYNTVCRFQPLGVHNARLTLASNTPVTTTDVTAAGTLYLTPYGGGTVELWNNLWLEIPLSQLSLSLTGMTSDLPYDIYLEFSGAGLGPPQLNKTAWTNTTTRATALTIMDGKLFVGASSAKRLYLGTILMSATGQCEDSALKRYVWNYYNRVKRHFNQYIGVTAYAYTTGSWRQWNADANAQVSFVVGVVEDSVLSIIGGSIWAGAGYLSLGLNSTTGTAPSVRNGNANAVEGGQSRDWMPQAGKNIVYATQYGAAGTNFSVVSLTGHILG